jgi:tRNA A37 threonylcarbamoyladenosine synthetase subunit TsaC/SUA5/YrdC
MDKIFIIPTNTCFWLACRINDKDSYEKIYEIKSRDFFKALAILVLDFKYLEKNTLLTDEQIEFLKQYEKPFTILVDKNNILDKSLLKSIKKLKNSSIYQKIAFRVSHNFIQEKIVKKYWLLFLTSANKSNEWEIFSSKKIKKIFKNEIEKFNIKIFTDNNFCIKSLKKSSDIFEFIWDTTKIKYLRK